MERRLSIKDLIAKMNQPSDSNSATAAAAGTDETKAPTENKSSHRTVGKLNLQKYKSPTDEDTAEVKAAAVTPVDNSAVSDKAEEPDNAATTTRRMSVKERIAAMAAAKESAQKQKPDDQMSVNSAATVESERPLSIAERAALFKPHSDTGSVAGSELSVSPETIGGGEENAGGEESELSEFLPVSKRLAAMKKKEKKEPEKPPAEKRPSAVMARIKAIEPPPAPTPAAPAEARKPASAIAERMALFKAKETAPAAATSAAAAGAKGLPPSGQTNRRASTGGAVASKTSGGSTGPAAKTPAAKTPAATATTAAGGQSNRRASTGASSGPFPTDFQPGTLSIADRIAAMKSKSTDSGDSSSCAIRTEKPAVSKLKRIPTGESTVIAEAAETAAAMTTETAVVEETPATDDTEAAAVDVSDANESTAAAAAVAAVVEEAVPETATEATAPAEEQATAAAAEQE